MRRIPWIVLASLVLSLLDPHAAEAHVRRHESNGHHARVHAAAHFRHEGRSPRHGGLSQFSHHGRRLFHRGHWRELRDRDRRFHHAALKPLHHGHQSAANLHPGYHRIARGVGFWEGRLDTPAGPVHFAALKIDLRLADVAPVAALSPRGDFALERTSLLAFKDHAIAGINGSFFSPHSREPAGMLVVGGRLLAGPVSRPALVMRGNGTASILPDRTAMRRDPLQALGGGPTLLRSGNVMFWGRPPAIGGRQPRTAVGLCPGHTVILLTIDGRSRGSIGATLAEEARYMAALGAKDAINLDGGGSTTMVIGTHVVNHPSDGFERSVSNALMVFPKDTHLLRRFLYSGFDSMGS